MSQHHLRRDGAPAGPGPSRDPTRLRRQELVRDARAIIATEFARDLRLSEVARRIATSERQLQRAFGDEGTSFTEALAGARFARAAELLITTDLTVTDVARSVGYRQPAQFARTFAQRYGLAPVAFRRAWRERG